MKRGIPTSSPTSRMTGNGPLRRGKAGARCQRNPGSRAPGEPRLQASRPQTRWPRGDVTKPARPRGQRGSAAFHDHLTRVRFRTPDSELHNPASRMPQDTAATCPWDNTQPLRLADERWDTPDSPAVQCGRNGAFFYSEKCPNLDTSDVVTHSEGACWLVPAPLPHALPLPRGLRTADALSSCSSRRRVLPSPGPVPRPRRHFVLTAHCESTRPVARG